MPGPLSLGFMPLPSFEEVSFLDWRIPRSKSRRMRSRALHSTMLFKGWTYSCESWAFDIKQSLAFPFGVRPVGEAGLSK